MFNELKSSLSLSCTLSLTGVFFGFVKVMRFITLEEVRGNYVPQTCGPELKHALHTVHQLALQATETLVADE